MKYIIASVLFCLLYELSMAQGEANNWYFGVKSGISFNSGIPQPLYNSQMSAAEGCSSISDRNGNLLFYSDGYFIWNRNHQRMTKNGVLSIIGDNSDGTQTGVIVPWPDNDSLYYVFSLGQLGGNLYYSVVNMNRNGGLGEVTNKKVLLQTEVCEKLTAVRHCNKRDYWVVTHKFNSDEYCSFIINPTGLSHTPVLSPTGNFIVNSNGMEFSNTMGYLKNSPDGRLLAAAHYVNDYVELTDFNTTTGTVANPRKLYVRPQGVISPVFDGAYGIEFSHDSRVMYVSSYYGPPHNDTTALYQFDVTQNSEAAIQASRVFIYGADWGNNTLTALQLGPDKKIYVAKYGEYLSVINNPDILGLGCQFTVDALYIDDGTLQHHIAFGLPNFIQSYFNDPLIVIGNCEFSNISFSLHNLVGITDALWDFGDPESGTNNTSTSLNPSHIFSKEGQYKIKAVLNYANGCDADTIYKLVHAGEFMVFLGNDTTICRGDTLMLRMKIPNGSNHWNTGSSDTTLAVTKAGRYWVKVNVGECTAVDTINILFAALPEFSLGNDTVICSNQSYVVRPNLDFQNSSYLWSTGSTQSSISVAVPGSCWLSVSEFDYGCKFTDTLNIQARALPEYNLGIDTTLCENEKLTLNATVDGVSKYQWNTGETTPIISISKTGNYWADIEKEGCSFRDSISVLFKSNPSINLGIDTTLCEGQTLKLTVEDVDVKLLWQDSSSSNTYSVISKGNYWVKVTHNGCTTSDTVSINYNSKPSFTLGKDKGICDGQSLLLQPALHNSTNVSWMWNTGTRNSNFNVTKSGTYILTASNDCGSHSDTIEIYKGICKMYVPTAFSPNNDGLNDLFKPTFGGQVSEYSLQIFNRWGEMVFNSKDNLQGWNGFYRGRLQPVGSYVWVIHYREGRDLKKEINGTVVLLR